MTETERILIEVHGYDPQEAARILAEMRERVEAGEDGYDVVAEFGLDAECAEDLI
jgi:hypothetical protein